MSRRRKAGELAARQTRRRAMDEGTTVPNFSGRASTSSVWPSAAQQYHS